MLMVIFGAGASYDSVRPANLVEGRHPYFRPPLAKDLFVNGPIQGEAINRYLQVRPIIPRLRNSSQDGPPVERELELIRSEVKSMPGHHRMLIALRYYLRHLLHTCAAKWHEYAYGVTNYVEFLYRLEKWRSRERQEVCLVSFNYDTLLDAAARESLTMNLSEVGHYISHDAYKLIKPHGSVDWGVRLNRTLQGSMDPADIERLVIDLGENLYPSDDYYLTMGQSIQNPVDPSTNCPLVPAIAIPMEQKSDIEFVSPKSHLHHLGEAIKKTDWVIVVGWRGNEEHFLSLWSEKRPTLRHVLVVGAGDTGKVAHNLSRPGLIQSGCNVSDYQDGFSKFLETPGLEEFLGVLD